MSSSDDSSDSSDDSSDSSEEEVKPRRRRRRRRKRSIRYDGRIVTPALYKALDLMDRNDSSKTDIDWILVMLRRIAFRACSSRNEIAFRAFLLVDAHSSSLTFDISANNLAAQKSSASPLTNGSWRRGMLQIL